MMLHTVQRKAIALAVFGLLACTGCGMGSQKSPAGSAGIADSAASAASATPPPGPAGSAPGAR